MFTILFFLIFLGENVSGITFGFIGISCLFQEPNCLPSGCLVHDIDKVSPSRSSTYQDSAPKLEFDDGDIDDELDPAMKEELDRYNSFFFHLTDNAYII